MVTDLKNRPALPPGAVQIFLAELVIGSRKRYN
jgi:hypothetical protein